MIRAPVLLRSLSTAPVVLRRGVASNAAALLAEDDALSKARPFSEVPCPRGAIPLLGHLPLLANKSGKERFELFGRLLKELGPIVRLKLPRPLRNLVLLSNPSETEKVLRNDGQYPLRSTAMGKNLQYMFKDMDSPTPFAFLDGKEWKDLRVLHHKQIRPANVHSYSPGINIATDRLLTALESSRNEDGYVEDIFPPVVNWAMEASAWFALGIDLDLTKEDNEEAKRFQQSIQTFIRSVDYMVQAIPIYKIYPTKKYTEAKESLAAARLLGRKYVERNRTAIEKRLREGGSTHDGLSLIEQWMIEGNMSEEQCIISALDMFAAGVDTTANYTTFVLYEIAKHPEVQQKLHQQVVSVLGKDGEADPESLQKMPYLRDIIRETHRVRPVIVGLVRELTKEIELMGYRIPAGASVLSCTPSCGAGTLKFDPDRWTRDEDKPHPFADLPFGFGPRSCFGRRFAELEMKVLLTKMIRRFNMSVDGPPDAELPVEHETLFRPAVPVKIKLSSRV